LENIMQKVWLITGASRGLGRSIAERVLAGGDLLVATARDPASLADLLTRHPQQVRVATLDVTDSAAARAAVQVAIDAFGRLDVLVNNAGYGQVAPFEQLDEDEFRSQIDTNLYGVVNVTRAAVPFMRKQRSGHIIQVSSVGGRMGTPGMSAYQAAKWAVGGFTEVLVQELAPLGVKITAIEPGGMRTNWVARAGQGVPDILPDYADTVGAVAGMLGTYVGHETGDPVRVADVVWQLSRHDDPPVHLLLGSDAVHFSGLADAQRAASAETWKTVSLSTDADNAGPRPVLPGER
jgi:NAD(P)-dependent dehydrogenase (short-subunit alcohol dehydrogenase family)